MAPPRPTILVAPTAGLLLGLAIVAGGGSGPVLPVLVEVGGALALAPALASRLPRPLPPGFAAMATLIILLLGLLGAQLIPLPPSVWQALPGRALDAAIATHLGVAQGWRPLSLLPDNTVSSALALVPGIAMFLLTVRASIEQRRFLLAIVVVGALASALLGMTQVATGGPYLYHFSDAGDPTGFFANHNHEANLLLLACLLGAALLGDDRRGTSMPLAALLLLLSVAVISTRSRAGISLLPLALLGASLIGYRPRRDTGAAASTSVLAIAAGAIIAIAMLLATQSSVVQAALARFGAAGSDLRFGMWSDTMFAIRQYWPVGSGIGSFVPVYQGVETLEAMTPSYVNNAHQDYLEVVLDTGIAGIVLIAAYLAILTRQMLLPAPAGSLRMQRLAALFGIAILLMHSLVDYPLRELALSTIFGLLNGMLLTPAGHIAPSRGGRGVVPKREAPALTMSSDGMFG